jgi:hypothetical protein
MNFIFIIIFAWRYATVYVYINFNEIFLIDVIRRKINFTSNVQGFSGQYFRTLIRVRPQNKFCLWLSYSTAAYLLYVYEVR